MLSGINEQDLLIILALSHLGRVRSILESVFRAPGHLMPANEILSYSQEVIRRLSVLSMPACCRYEKREQDLN